MTSPAEAAPPSSSSAGAILDLVRSGRARSRAEIARSTGLSPSTVAQRVDGLIGAGLVREAGEGVSARGRRPRALEIDASAGVVCAVDLGSHHATFGLVDISGRLLAVRSEPMDIADGPDRVLRWIVTIADEMVAAHAEPGQTLRGYGIGLPGPVDSNTGEMVSPSRMPGWKGVDAAGLLASLTSLPVAVDNDANLMALGEHAALDADAQHLVFVKAGSSIGCGVIAFGGLYHGHHGMAGDISHVTVPGGPQVLCSCGRIGCLDAVAGGAAIVTALRDAGVEVADARDVVALARDAHPRATLMLREAGLRVGSVLATIMNFYNPQRLVLGGILGEAEAFVAGVRSSLYSDCLPMITDELEITVSVAKEKAGILGAAHLVLDELFDHGRVEQLVR
ncbi:ROK family transcriptional regulator [Microbacterium sp. ASV49]|uniref:ROK family transcriptional regulator n=1 Tax=Microbacterium candidum TaxID=3041922 RepID=A0ABT7N0H4_9MICO|nr:ROK family transcriptional regulator [Microbacterium sp. ASV49]MDL9980202.1 ROK family transcriptional regulator [Microbacterium sp. ASV49]